MSERIVASIEFDGKKVTFEGPEDFVRGEIQRLSSLTRKPDSSGSQPQVAPPVSERDILAAKQPRGHHEIVSVLAFALKEQGSEEFTEDDIRRAYLRANIRPPKHVDQALRDAKSKFDFIETGTKRGIYKLSHHGERTVRFDLPRKDKSA